ncbi:MAG: DUF411 domain-containing protein [Gammaproteobacteria bacterium]|nr:DUF411 domain-containing protein [Gammaproteobacteria bacterium]
MKSILGILFTFISFNALSADPYWKHGVTEDRHEIIVYRSETCGCCKGWISHLRDHNFDVKDIRVKTVNPYKQNLDIPMEAASCHTAVVDGVAIEGHVPAQDIKRLLANRGDIRLLTVPAMPSGTPGMDTPGASKNNFNVYAINKDNSTSIYKSYSNY